MSSSCGAPHSKLRSKQLQSSASVTGEAVGEDVVVPSILSLSMKLVTGDGVAMGEGVVVSSLSLSLSLLALESV